MSFKVKLIQWYGKRQRSAIIQVLLNKHTYEIPEKIVEKIKSEYMDDPYIVGEALFKGVLSLNDVKEEFKKDINIVRYALKRDGMALKYADPKFRDDVELIKLIVTHHPEVLCYASDNVKNSRDLFLDWIKTYPKVAYYVSSELQKDMKFIYTLLGKNLKAYAYLPQDLKTNKTLALDIIKKDFHLIKDMDENLQNDLEILLTASYYARNEEPKQYAAPFYFQHVIDNSEACYIYENRYVIAENTFSLIKEALLKNSAAVITPPESIKVLIEGAEDPFLLLAQYALGENLTIALDTTLPENLLI